jgi:heme A synthase
MSLRKFAVVVPSLTFVLLLMGGIVHNTGSSLACPDWPLCNGQVFPKMQDGVLIEHSHRLVAGTVALLTLGLLVAFRRRAAHGGDAHIAKVATVAFALVVVQAVLGGITVKLRLPPVVSVAHLAVSQLFLQCLIYLAFLAAADGAPARAPLAGKVQRMTAWAAGLVYAQMILGAFVRHLGVGMSCGPEIPLCQGQLWPTGVHPFVSLHVIHRFFALVVLGHLVGTAIVVAKNAPNRAVKLLGIAAPLLAVVQISLGLLMATSFLDIVPRTAHLGVAAALLADLVALHLYARGSQRNQNTSASPAANRKVAA